MNSTIIVSLFLLFAFVVFVFKKFSQFKREVASNAPNGQNLSSEFSYLISAFNEYCYKGQGDINKLDQEELNIYKNDSCQIVHLHYSMGTLTIVWKFKYYQQEMIYKKSFNNVPSINSMEWQLNAFKLMVAEFLEQYEVHKAKVDASGIVSEKISSLGISPEQLKAARDLLK